LKVHKRLKEIQIYVSIRKRQIHRLSHSLTQVSTTNTGVSAKSPMSQEIEAKMKHKGLEKGTGLLNGVTQYRQRTRNQFSFFEKPAPRTRIRTIHSFCAEGFMNEIVLIHKITTCIESNNIFYDSTAVQRLSTSYHVSPIRARNKSSWHRSRYERSFLELYQVSWWTGEYPLESPGMARICIL
jgi:hypothetical protein